MNDSTQRLIVSAKEDNIFWRGEDITDFYRVIAEFERVQKLGPEDYRKEAVSRIRKIKICGPLPYDKAKREYGSQNGKDSQKDNGDSPRQDVESDYQRVVNPSQSDSEQAKAPNPIRHESGDAGRSGDDVTADEPW